MLNLDRYEPKKQLDQLWLKSGRPNAQNTIWLADDIFLTESKQGHSPSGSQALEDLRIVDAKDPAASAVLIMHRNGDNFTVYRRVFRTTQIATL